MNAARLKSSMKSVDRSQSVLTGLVDRTTKQKCGCCGHTLFVGQLGPGTIIEVKCKECKECTPFGVAAGSA